MSAERQLADQLLGCWLTHGSASAEFQSLVNHAATEFDAAEVIFALTACSVALILFASDYLGSVEDVRAHLTTHLIEPHQEAHTS